MINASKLPCRFIGPFPSCLDKPLKAEFALDYTIEKSVEYTLLLQS